MPYKYYTTASPTYFKLPSNTLLSEFQENINVQFYNAPNAFVIQEESSIGSDVYEDVEVRIDRAINAYTGEKLGDDFKTILFRDLTHSASVGMKYYFDDNYWIIVNSEIIKNFAASATVRRCNNILRWIDTNGILYSEHCAIEYKISKAGDSIGPMNPVLPQGYIDVYCQLNNKTKYIRGNQRFLFGPVENRIGFKIFGNGVRNYLNQETIGDDSGTLMLLSMSANFVNQDTDNIILGIADYYSNYMNLNSGSNIGALDIVVNPSVNYILESGSALFDVRYYSGSTVLSGSFVFTTSGSVPSVNYVFAQESSNTFSIYNISRYSNATLDILCSGSSGSRVLSFDLRGAW
jgi:hypothetical protein